MATCKNETDHTIIVYDVDNQKTLEIGDTAIVYRSTEGSGLTVLSEAPYYSPILESNNGLSLVAGTPTIIDANPRALSMLLNHVSSGFLTLRFNDISTPGMIIKAGENLTVPITRYLKKVILVSSENCTCDVTQFEIGATESHFIWS